MKLFDESDNLVIRLENAQAKINQLEAMLSKIKNSPATPSWIVRTIGEAE